MEQSLNDEGVDQELAFSEGDIILVSNRTCREWGLVRWGFQMRKWSTDHERGSRVHPRYQGSHIALEILATGEGILYGTYNV